MMDSIPGRVYGSVHTQNKGSFGAMAYGSDRQLHCCPLSSERQRPRQDRHPDHTGRNCERHKDRLRNFPT